MTEPNEWKSRAAQAAAQKRAFVEDIADTLMNTIVGSLMVDASGYGEGGWHQGATELDESDAWVVAVQAWYTMNELPTPQAHVLYQEASHLRTTRRGKDLSRQPLRDLLTSLALIGWDAETSADPDNYERVGRPSYGQCAVTALVVQDLVGGDLLRVEVTDKVPYGQVGKTVSHYYNLLPDGTELDATRDQFDSFIPGDNVTEPELRTREYVMSHPATVQRYDQLKKNLTRYG